MQGLYIAQVTKSTAVNGIARNRISTIKYPTLTSRDGCPGWGFVLWHSDTLPPRTVAQDGSTQIAKNSSP